MNLGTLTASNAKALWTKNKCNGLSCLVRRVLILKLHIVKNMKQILLSSILFMLCYWTWGICQLSFNGQRPQSLWSNPRQVSRCYDKYWNCWTILKMWQLPCKYSTWCIISGNCCISKNHIRRTEEKFQVPLQSMEFRFPFFECSGWEILALVFDWGVWNMF